MLPLFQACLNGHTDTADLLLESGATSLPLDKNMTLLGLLGAQTINRKQDYERGLKYWRKALQLLEESKLSISETLSSGSQGKSTGGNQGEDDESNASGSQGELLDRDGSQGGESTQTGSHTIQSQGEELPETSGSRREVESPSGFNLNRVDEEGSSQSGNMTGGREGNTCEGRSTNVRLHCGENESTPLPSCGEQKASTPPGDEQVKFVQFTLMR